MIPQGGHWKECTNEMHMGSNEKRNIAMPPMIIPSRAKLSQWHRVMAEHLFEKRNVICGVMGDVHLEPTSFRRETERNFRRLEIAAMMPAIPGHSFCAFDDLDISTAQYRSIVTTRKREWLGLAASTENLGLRLSRIAKLGYMFDIPKKQELPFSSNKRFGANMEDIQTLVNLGIDAFGSEREEEFGRVFHMTQESNHTYMFAIRNPDGRIVSFVVANCLHTVSIGENEQMYVFEISDAITSKAEQGKGLMSALIYKAVCFVQDILENRPGILYMEARADGIGILRSARNVGFQFSGTLPIFSDYKGKPVDVDILHLPISKIHGTDEPIIL